MEEERRLFYVALTRSKSRLDVLTVQGAESVFIDELPDSHEHLRPLPQAELNEIETNREIRKSLSGRVIAKNRKNFATFDWDGRGLVDLNLYDATASQKRMIEIFEQNGETLTLENCGIQYRDSYGEEANGSQRLQLQLDDEVGISNI